MSEELNDSLKARNFTLNERNEYLEKMNKDLVNDVGNIKVSEAKIQEEVENKYKDLCANYDNVSIFNYTLKTRVVLFVPSYKLLGLLFYYKLRIPLNFKTTHEYYSYTCVSVSYSKHIYCLEDY